MLDEQRQIVRELENLAEDFRATRLASVKGTILVSRESDFSRNSIPKPSMPTVRLSRRISENCSAEFLPNGKGFEVRPLWSCTPEDFGGACWYMRHTGAAIVNSVGDSLAAETGWSSYVDGELAGEHLEEAWAAIERANNWLFSRLSFVANAILPSRNLCLHSPSAGWPDVVLEIAKIGDATMTKPDWQVEIGCVELIIGDDGLRKLVPTNNRRRQLLSTSIWELRKNKDYWPDTQGCEPFRSITEADELFIGDPPEVRWCKLEIKGFLRDSELACDWLRRYVEENTEQILKQALPESTPSCVESKTISEQEMQSILDWTPSKEDRLKEAWKCVLTEWGCLASDKKSNAMGFWLDDPKGSPPDSPTDADGFEKAVREYVYIRDCIESAVIPNVAGGKPCYEASEEDPELDWRTEAKELLTGKRLSLFARIVEYKHFVSFDTISGWEECWRNNPAKDSAIVKALKEIKDSLLALPIEVELSESDRRARIKPIQNLGRKTES